MKNFLSFLFTIIVLNTAAQNPTYTNTRQLRFVSIVTASDTAATVANNGRVWFDFTSQKIRGIKNATAYTLGEGGGGCTTFTINSQTASYQPVLADGQCTLIRQNVVGANTFTIPANATVAYEVGTIIMHESIGDQTTYVAAGGVTLNASAGNLLSPADYAPVAFVKVATNTWDVWNGTPATPNAISGSLTATRVAFASGTNTLTDDADLTFTGGNTLNTTNAIITTGLTNSALTSGRIHFSTTGGLFTDDADLTFSGGNTLNATNVSTTSLTADGISLGSAGTAGSLRSITVNGSASDIGFGIFAKRSSGNPGFGYEPTADEFEFQFGSNGSLDFLASGTNIAIGTTSGYSLSFTTGDASGANATDFTISTGSGNSGFNAGNIIISPSTAVGGGTDGSIYLETHGSTGTIKVNAGANEQAGLATLVGGTVTVNNTKVTANSYIFTQHRTKGGTPGIITYTIVAGTSFTLNSESGTDTSTVNWWIVEPN